MPRKTNRIIQADGARMLFRVHGLTRSGGEKPHRCTYTNHICIIQIHVHIIDMQTCMCTYKYITYIIYIYIYILKYTLKMNTYVHIYIYVMPQLFERSSHLFERHIYIYIWCPTYSCIAHPQKDIITVHSASICHSTWWVGFLALPTVSPQNYWHLKGQMNWSPCRTKISKSHHLEYIHVWCVKFIE